MLINYTTMASYIIMTKRLKHIFLFLLFSMCQLYMSQTKFLSSYPKFQEPYVGGDKGYYKDFHDIVFSKNLKTCNDQNEIYQFRVLVMPDSTISFVQELNANYLERNKCAYDMARTVAKYQKKWLPANEDGKATPALASFIIYPQDIFNNYYEGYLPKVTYPFYGKNPKESSENFKKDLLNKIDLSRFIWNDIFFMEIEFIINKEGKMEDVVLLNTSGLESFDKRILWAFKDLKTKWSPATINSVPFNYRYRFSLRIITDIKK